MVDGLAGSLRAREEAVARAMMLLELKKQSPMTNCREWPTTTYGAWTEVGAVNDDEFVLAGR